MFVTSFAHVATKLRLPRVLVTPHHMGRTIGPVGDRVRQRAVVAAALDLLVTAEGPETVRLFDPAG